jgi:hypothetical protein
MNRALAGLEALDLIERGYGAVRIRDRLTLARWLASHTV